MGAIRKSPHTRQMPDFRRQLQRALSLSSSESEYSQSPTGSLSGVTTEEDSTHPDGNNQAAPQRDDSPDVIENGTLPIPTLGAHGAQSGLPRNSNILALQCVAELELRVKSLESSMADQSKCIEDVRGQLVDLSRRWEAIETEADKRSERELDEPEQKTLRVRRSQR